MQIEINTFIQKNLKQLTNKNFSKKYISQYIAPIITNIYTSKNNKALKFLSSKKIIIKEFPKEVLDSLREISIEVLKEISSTDKITREVYLSYIKFKEEVIPWTKLSEKSYINSRD